MGKVDRTYFAVLCPGKVSIAGESMCEPRKCRTVGSIPASISSAISSLNMTPDPVEPTEVKEDGLYYLSETDRWVQHCIEHLTQLTQDVSEMAPLIDRIRIDLMLAWSGRKKFDVKEVRAMRFLERLLGMEDDELAFWREMEGLNEE